MPKTCHHRPVTSSQYDGEAVEVGSRGDNGDTLKNIHSKVESPKPAIITLLRLPNMAEKWWSLGDKGGNGDTLKKYAGKSRKPKSPYTRTTIVYIYIYIYIQITQYITSLYKQKHVAKHFKYQH